MATTSPHGFEARRPASPAKAIRRVFQGSHGTILENGASIFLKKENIIAILDS
jgi:hypothetical protein